MTYFFSFLDIFELMLSFKFMNILASFWLYLCGYGTSWYRDALGHIL